MRKWVRIAAVLVLVTVVLSVPRSELEIHKRKCQGAWSSLQGTSITARIKRLYSAVTGVRSKSSHWEDEKRLWNSQEALIEVGYLTRARFVLTNAPDDVEKAFYKECPQDAFTRVEWPWRTSDVWIIARTSEMPRISNIVWRIDAGADPSGRGGGRRLPGQR